MQEQSHHIEQNVKIRVHADDGGEKECKERISSAEKVDFFF